MDRKRAELEDRSAKWQRFTAENDGITFRSDLAKADEGSRDAKPLKKRQGKDEAGAGGLQSFQATQFTKPRAASIQHSGNRGYCQVHSRQRGCGANNAVARNLRS